MATQALFSVFDKSGCVEFAKSIQKSTQCSVISTGGTFKVLSEGGLNVKQVESYFMYDSKVSDITHFPELLEGRVKTLHPNIHAALLAKMDSEKHKKELADHGIAPIQLVVVNLYPFEATVQKSNVTIEEALENIDIGGVTLIRAAAKNFPHVIVVVDPEDYGWISEKIEKGGFSSLSSEERKQLAHKAFLHCTAYDSAIASYLSSGTSVEAPKVLTRSYQHQFNLKYGINPHQIPAAIYTPKVLNGTPGCINLMDALNGWQLVKELKQATNLAAAASFKHVSPAGKSVHTFDCSGAAVAVPLNEEESEVFEATGKTFTPTALAYLRARNADPMSSYGDFAAVSEEVDEATATLLKAEVSDGIIAPNFSAKALEILKTKKGGAYIVIQIDPSFEPNEIELREIFGIGFIQKRNVATLSPSNLSQIITKKKDLTPDAIRDLLVATITLKYTQSNSVGYAMRGGMLGVGAGQQSRVDCAKLAGSKVRQYYLRFHPKIRGIKFVSGSKRMDRVNARVHVIEGSVQEEEKKLFESEIPSLDEAEKKEWLTHLTGVSLSSDAFFPFRDSLDVAAKLGVRNVCHPGGSIQDESVTKAADEYGMVMATTGVRLFHH